MSAIRRLIIPAMAAITALAVAPSAALAATSPAAAAARRNYFILYFNSEPPGAHRSYACNGGARYVVPALLAQAELSARNNCSVRVWLHLNPNGSGRALCIRPHSNATIRRPYRQVWISRNPATC